MPNFTPTTYTVTNIAEYVELVEKCTKQWFQEETSWGPWFRGQSDATWALCPGLYRYSPTKRDIRTLEDEIRQEFIVRAPSLGPERPSNSWELYFLMQHCGAPTRLLDWTECALIALFFAIRNQVATSNTDAAVWVLEPWKLNEAVAGVKEVIPPGATLGMVPEHAAFYGPWLPDRYSNPGNLAKSLPIAIYPTHFSRRISSQRSCFTIHGSDPNRFSHLPGEFGAYLWKIIIPRDRVHAIETSLAVAGIDEITVFPDLDGLGRWLTAVLREESWAATVP